MASNLRKRVAILVSNHFEQSEFEEPLHALQDAGHIATVISSESLDLQGMHHAEKGDTFQADMLLGDADANDFDALVLPGGTLNADALRVVEKAQEWVTEFLDTNRLLAVICHAPWVLVSADAVEGLRMTSYHTIRDDIVNAGGEWVNLPVVLDTPLITSRQPGDLPAFIETILNKLAQESDLLDEEDENPSRARSTSTTQSARTTETRLHLESRRSPDRTFRSTKNQDEPNNPKTLYPTIAAPKDEQTDTH